MPNNIMWSSYNIELVEPVKVCQNKEYCAHCGSTSYDDMRGNCCACGAPRERICRQLPVMATQGTFGDNPLVSMAYAREKILGITDEFEKMYTLEWDEK